MAEDGKRLNIVKMLPVHQRGAVVADAVSALWAEGGHAYTHAQMQSSITKSAVALMGSSSEGAVVGRSRPLTNLLGSALHRTHWPCAIIFYCIL